MIDTGSFETAFVIFALTLAALVAVGIGLIVSTARRERDEVTGTESTAPAKERARELVS